MRESSGPTACSLTVLISGQLKPIDRPSYPLHSLPVALQENGRGDEGRAAVCSALHAMRPSLLSPQPHTHTPTVHSTTDGARARPRRARARQRSNALIYSNHLTASDNRIIAPLDNIRYGMRGMQGISRGSWRGGEGRGERPLKSGHSHTPNASQRRVTLRERERERGRKQLTRTVTQPPRPALVRWRGGPNEAENGSGGAAGGISPLTTILLHQWHCGSAGKTERKKERKKERWGERQLDRG